MQSLIASLFRPFFYSPICVTSSVLVILSPRGIVKFVADYANVVQAEAVGARGGSAYSRLTGNTKWQSLALWLILNLQDIVNIAHSRLTTRPGVQTLATPRSKNPAASRDSIMNAAGYAPLVKRGSSLLLLELTANRVVDPRLLLQIVACSGQMIAAAPSGFSKCLVRTLARREIFMMIQNESNCTGWEE